MLGIYRPKAEPADGNKQIERTTRTRPAVNVENGPRTRSASTRRAKEQPITITYLGRSRTASESDATTSVRAVRSSTSKKLQQSVSVKTKTDDLSSSSSSDSVSFSSSSQAAAFIDILNKIGATAKTENKYIRRLKVLNSRNSRKFEEEVAKNERLAFAAIQFLTKRNIWSLNACYAYLPIIIENLVSQNASDQSIVLNGLESISDTVLEPILRFATGGATRIGVDVVAEERAAKAKECVRLFRGIVKNRDAYYKQLDENAIFQLDNILAQLKKA
ncbi:hypothetical protein L5515_001897 [Caenorhabditis briggsae]|uniref:Katanin p80 subunit C-terminal domain-containing protein n=1 Tax=Caenorhabditis briggsae TaxID=6238 RepID=A0AAE9E6I7_CAEBR|nr:hypothetical protein L5515_001897 [Caenorhabditis briggsae]